VTNTFKAITLMMVSMALFTTLDASAKYVGREVPLPTAVLFRYGVAFLMSTGLVWYLGGIHLLRTKHPYLQILRGLLLLAATACNFFAMQYLQLAQVSAIFFTIPLLVCALSVPILGEHVGLRRWLAVLVGFAGVLLIMRPGTVSFHWAMLISLTSALFGSLYNIVTRMVGKNDSVETSLFYVGFVGAAGAFVPGVMTWQMPVGWQWLPLVLMGVCGTIGHFMLIQAHRLAPASTIAPYIYSQIIWMIAAGALVFGQYPDQWTLVGAAIVVASGIYVFSREHKKGVTAEAAAPVD
jgi:drug/metabolite transporter (DMT)-like permease